MNSNGQHAALPWFETLVSSQANMIGTRKSLSGQVTHVLYASLYLIPEFTVDKTLLGVLYLAKGSDLFTSRLSIFPNKNRSFNRDRSCFLKSNTVTSTT